MAGGTADADQFRCPAAGDDTAAAATWSNLPLHHALRWLHALGLKPKAQLANVLLYVEADGCSLARARECAAEWHSERKARHAECAARAKLDSETWEPQAEWAEHEAAQWRDFAGWNLSLTESIPPPLTTRVDMKEAEPEPEPEAGAEAGAGAEREAKAAILRRELDLEGGPERVAEQAAMLLGLATAGLGTDAIIDWCLETIAFFEVMGEAV